MYSSITRHEALMLTMLLIQTYNTPPYAFYSPVSYITTLLNTVQSTVNMQPLDKHISDPTNTKVYLIMKTQYKPQTLK